MNRKSRSLLGLHYGSRQSLADQYHSWQVPVLGSRGRRGHEPTWMSEGRKASSLPQGRGKTLPRYPRPERTRLVFQRVKQSLSESIESMVAQSSNVSAQPSPSNSLRSPNSKDWENVTKKMRVLLSKIRELEERYSLFMKLWEGVRTMSQAYIIHGGSNLKASLESVHAGCMECVQTLCLIEANLESLLGTFHFTLQGLSGFARLMPGDVFEIAFRYGLRKCKSRCKISSSNQQSCQPQTFEVLVLLVEPLFVRVQELKCIGKGPVMGEKNCDTIELLKTHLQAITINLNPSGSVKLDMFVQWRPVEDFSIEIPNSFSDSALHRVHNLSPLSLHISSFITPNSKIHGHDSSRYSLPVGTSSSYLTPPPDFIPSFLTQSIEPSPAQSIASDSVSRSTYREHSSNLATPSRTDYKSGRTRVEVYKSGIQVDDYLSGTQDEMYPNGIQAVESSSVTLAEAIQASSDEIPDGSQKYSGRISLKKYQDVDENYARSAKTGIGYSSRQSHHTSPENTQSSDYIDTRTISDGLNNNDNLTGNVVKDDAIISNSLNRSRTTFTNSSQDGTYSDSIRNNDFVRDNNANLSYDASLTKKTDKTDMNVLDSMDLGSSNIVDNNKCEVLKSKSVSTYKASNPQFIEDTVTRDKLEHFTVATSLSVEKTQRFVESSGSSLTQIASQKDYLHCSQTDGSKRKASQNKSIDSKEISGCDTNYNYSPTRGLPRISEASSVRSFEVGNIESDGHVTSAIDDALEAFSFLESDEYLMSVGEEEMDEQQRDVNFNADTDSSLSQTNRTSIVSDSIVNSSSSLTELRTDFTSNSTKNKPEYSTNFSKDSSTFSTNSTIDNRPTDISTSFITDSIGFSVCSSKDSIDFRPSTSLKRDSTSFSTSTENSTDFSTTSTRHSTDISSNSSGYNSGFSTNSIVQMSTHFGIKALKGFSNNSPDSNKSLGSDSVYQNSFKGATIGAIVNSTSDTGSLGATYKSIGEIAPRKEINSSIDEMQYAEYTASNLDDTNDLNLAMQIPKQNSKEGEFKGSTVDLQSTSVPYNEGDETDEQSIDIRL